MPLYEYACSACGHEFEELARSMSQETDVSCPSCGARRARRKLSVFAARQGNRSEPAGGRSPCGRCGDPEGPCSL